MNRSKSTLGPFVQTDDGVRLFYQDWGTGSPIVLVHALGMNSDQWQYNIADLEQSGHRCIAYDRRGHGRSDRPLTGYTFPRLVDDLAALMEELDLRDVTLLGFSMGAIEAAGYLSRHGRARVARLVLLAPSLPFCQKTANNPDGADRSAFEATFALWRRDYPTWLVEGPSRLSLFYRPDSFPISSGIVDWTRAMMRDTSTLQVQLRCGAVLLETDLRAELARIDVPTLVVHGDRDASMPVVFGRATAALIRGSRYIEYEGAPHGLFLTHRERLHADLCDWIDAGAGSPGLGRRRPPDVMVGRTAHR